MGVIAWKVFLLLQPSNFPIKKLVLDGKGFYYQFDKSKNSIVQLMHKGFFGLDLVEVRKILLKDVWLQDVSVRKIWPDTLYIRYIERKPIAWWSKEGFVTKQGEIFKPDYFSQSSELPVFFGEPQNSLQIVRIYSKIDKILSENSFSVSSITLKPRGSWKVSLHDGPKLMLGRKEVLERLNQFAIAYAKVAQLRDSQPQYVDLRYPHGMAIGLGNKDSW